MYDVDGNPIKRKHTRKAKSCPKPTAFCPDGFGSFHILPNEDPTHPDYDPTYDPDDEYFPSPYDSGLEPDPESYMSEHRINLRRSANGIWIH